MNVYDIVQIVLVTGAAAVVGRIGLAVARRIERRSTEIGALEEECAALRRELAELHERQAFTEQLLLTDAPRR